MGSACSAETDLKAMDYPIPPLAIQEPMNWKLEIQVTLNLALETSATLLPLCQHGYYKDKDLLFGIIYSNNIHIIINVFLCKWEEFSKYLLLNKPKKNYKERKKK